MKYRWMFKKKYFEWKSNFKYFWGTCWAV